MGNSQNKRASQLRARRKRREERIKARIKEAKAGSVGAKKKR